VDNSGFLCLHRMRLALSQVRALSRLQPGSGIPSISTAYAQAWRHCAQVIHMFVHRQHGRPAHGEGLSQHTRPTVRERTHWGVGTGSAGPEDSAMTTDVASVLRNTVLLSSVPASDLERFTTGR
jgi:hypothetical protein